MLNAFSLLSGPMTIFLQEDERTLMAEQTRRRTGPSVEMKEEACGLSTLRALEGSGSLWGA